jgi:hypothetical protein
MRTYKALSFLALAAAACGDPLVTAETRGDPLFSVRGSVSQGLASAPATPLEVGVVWLNLTDDNTTVYVEATPADAIGNTLPAGFEVAVIRPPSDRMLGTALLSYNEGGGQEQPVDRSRVAFGVLVVAPEGTFETLPASVSLMEFINSSSATPGPLLQSFTYVSPFTVRYVKGASAEGVTIRDINGVTSRLEDFTVFNVSAWARGVESSVCRDRELGKGWATPEVTGCIERETAANPDKSAQDIENGCLYEWASSHSAAFDATCGAQPDFAESDFRNARRLESSEQITLPLGDNDIRGGLTYGGFIFLG